MRPHSWLGHALSFGAECVRLIAVGGMHAGLVGQRGHGGDALRLCVASE